MEETEIIERKFSSPRMERSTELLQLIIEKLKKHEINMQQIKAHKIAEAEAKNSSIFSKILNYFRTKKANKSNC